MLQADESELSPPHEAAACHLALLMNAWEDSGELTLAFARRVIPLLADDLSKLDEAVTGDAKQLSKL
jgi:hypothetical protein